MKAKQWRRVAIAATLALGGAGTMVALTSGTAGAARPLARATLYNGTGVEIGEVTFKGTGTYANRVEVQVELPTGAPGLGAYHGLHVHAIGTCTAPAFTSAGGHWSLVSNAEHGNHTGDLPSVLIGSDGTGYAEFETPRFDVTQLFDTDGSAVVLHAGVDNFGNVPLGGGKYEDPNSWRTAPTGTANTGDAGIRYGCGRVVGT